MSIQQRATSLLFHPGTQISILALQGYHFLFNNYYDMVYIKGRSMQPTYSPIGVTDYAFGKRFFFSSGSSPSLERGEVITFLSPTRPGDVAVKRVVGLPGDEVTTRKSAKYPLEKVTVPPGTVWVEGDNQVHSVDSNEYGPLPISLIEARLTWITLPLDRRGPIVERPKNRRVRKPSLEKASSRI